MSINRLCSRKLTEASEAAKQGLRVGLIALNAFPIALGLPTWQTQVLAHPTLLAQQVVDRLPPPPPIPELQPSQQDNTTNPLPIDDISAEIIEDDTGELHMVYVNGDSPLLLQQVQRVEPTATLQTFEGQTVILVGMFERSSEANQQVAQLNQQGIQADVASVSRVVLSPNAPNNTSLLEELPPADGRSLTTGAPTASVTLPNGTAGSSNLRTSDNTSSTSTPSNVTSNAGNSSVSSFPPEAEAADSSDGAYYVVIPGRTSTLTELRQQVLLLGTIPAAVVQRERPLGPHLLVGPFTNQSAASRWNGYFREFGMDARVYYKR